MPDLVKSKPIENGEWDGWHLYEYANLNPHNSDYKDLVKKHSQGYLNQKVQDVKVFKKSNGNLQIYVLAPNENQRGPKNWKRKRSPNAGKPRMRNGKLSKRNESKLKLFGEGPIPRWTDMLTRERREDTGREFRIK